jgi:hypothetical protein
MKRPATLEAAALANVMIGVSGLAVGLTLFAAMAAAAVSSGALVGIPLILSIPAYGALATAGGIGLWRRSRLGWRVALVADLIGLGVLLWALTLSEGDAVIVGGLVIWGLAVALLVAPPTRAALNR